jgi:hypothetical protein
MLYQKIPGWSFGEVRVEIEPIFFEGKGKAEGVIRARAEHRHGCAAEV